MQIHSCMLVFAGMVRLISQLITWLVRVLDSDWSIAEFRSLIFLDNDRCASIMTGQRKTSCLINASWADTATANLEYFFVVFSLLFWVKPGQFIYLQLD